MNDLKCPFCGNRDGTFEVIESIPEAPSFRQGQFTSERKNENEETSSS